MDKLFNDFDISQFWEQSDYARREYVDDPVTEDLVIAVESASISPIARPLDTT